MRQVVFYGWLRGSTARETAMAVLIQTRPDGGPKILGPSLGLIRLVSFVGKNSRTIQSIMESIRESFQGSEGEYVKFLEELATRLMQHHHQCHLVLQNTNIDRAWSSRHYRPKDHCITSYCSSKTYP